MRGLIIRATLFVMIMIIGSLFSWWAAVIFAVISAFFVENFFEIIFIGVLYDILFHVPGSSWYMSVFHTGIFIGIILAMVGVQKIMHKPVIL